VGDWTSIKRRGTRCRDIPVSAMRRYVLEMLRIEHIIFQITPPIELEFTEFKLVHAAIAAGSGQKPSQI